MPLGRLGPRAFCLCGPRFPGLVRRLLRPRAAPPSPVGGWFGPIIIRFSRTPIDFGVGSAFRSPGGQSGQGCEALKCCSYSPHFGDRVSRYLTSTRSTTVGNPLKSPSVRRRLVAYGPAARGRAAFAGHPRYYLGYPSQRKCKPWHLLFLCFSIRCPGVPGSLLKIHCNPVWPGSKGIRMMASNSTVAPFFMAGRKRHCPSAARALSSSRLSMLCRTRICPTVPSA